MVKVNQIACVRISKALHSRFTVHLLMVLLFKSIRDFCDAEAKLLGYPPFNWEEWSFVIEKIYYTMLICILLLCLCTITTYAIYEYLIALCMWQTTNLLVL